MTVPATRAGTARRAVVAGVVHCHDIEEEPARFPRVVQRQDVRVAEPGRQPDLAHETVATERLCQVFMQDFDRDLAIVSLVAPDTPS